MKIRKMLFITVLTLGVASLTNAYAASVRASRNCNVALNCTDEVSVEKIKSILESKNYKVTNDRVEHSDFPLQEEFLLSGSISGEFPNISVDAHLIQMEAIGQGGEFRYSDQEQALTKKRANKKLMKMLSSDAFPTCDVNSIILLR